MTRLCVKNLQLLRLCIVHLLCRTQSISQIGGKHGESAAMTYQVFLFKSFMRLRCGGCGMVGHCPDGRRATNTFERVTISSSGTPYAPSRK